MKKLIIVSLVAIMIIATTIGALAIATAEPHYPAFTSAITRVVGEGESLWSIARDNLSKSGLSDVGEYAFYIREANPDLGNTIYPGQEIILPVVD